MRQLSIFGLSLWFGSTHSFNDRGDFTLIQPVSYPSLTRSRVALISAHDVAASP
jgi:hypothetical protein